MKKKFITPEICPVCGEDVPPRALACPECGADERSGWKDDATATDGLDLSDEEFNYEEFAAQEFGAGKPHGFRILPRNLLWIIAAIILLIAFALVYLVNWG